MLTLNANHNNLRTRLTLPLGRPRLMFRERFFDARQKLSVVSGQLSVASGQWSGASWPLVSLVPFVSLVPLVLGLQKPTNQRTTGY